MIDNHLQGKPLRDVSEIKLPQIYIEPPGPYGEAAGDGKRIEPARAEIEQRIRTFREIEASYTDEEARHEASRCRRCDLDYVNARKAR